MMKTMRMFNKILIANRGEIACRIIKTADRMGIDTVAIYSSADADSLHVSLANSALCIGPPEAYASYLNIDAIIIAALKSGAEAIHPGYGFLSENPDMARACASAGIVFIGPSIEAMEIMGSKQRAKQCLETTAIPLTPGYHGTDQSDGRLLEEAQRIGFPILIKPACGGGGKGMRTVADEIDFLKALEAARREAKASFADDTILIEKLISHPRHVEVQIMADNHGNIVHLYDRDCSIQRRHQKIIEEAPAPNLSKSLRQALADAAIAVAQAIDYRGAGTVEFLVDKPHFYFMEMNTRLQVEHPVTEMITGIDLVEWQLRIAANEPLPSKQNDISIHGHAVECRIYAEDPTNNFLPSIGQLHFLKEPSGYGLRLDSGINCSSHITQYYDPMISKLISWGTSRDEALHRLQHALEDYHIGGVKTNLLFLKAILQHSMFIKAELTTNFLAIHPIDIKPADSILAILMAVSFDYLCLLQSKDPIYCATFAWQMHLKSQWCSRYMINNLPLNIRVTPVDHQRLILLANDEIFHLKAILRDGKLSIDDGTQAHEAWVEKIHDELNLYTSAGPITIKPFDGAVATNHDPSTKGQLTAPMPATVVAILKNKGDTIKTGDKLMVLEAMKMEHTIHAPYDGLLVDIFYSIGAQVNEGTELVMIQTDT